MRESAQQVQTQTQQAHVHGPVPVYVGATTAATQALRSPSLVADTASTVSTLSQASTQPPPKIPIARRTSSIATTESNGGLTRCRIEASFRFPSAVSSDTC